jgi:hypothetical protein
LLLPFIYPVISAYAIILIALKCIPSVGFSGLLHDEVNLTGISGGKLPRTFFGSLSQ